MRIDLHTHSDRSDGTDSPTALIAAAAVARLDVVAITDHDSFAGWEEAVAAGRTYGVEVIGGVEISTIHAGASVHLLGYLPDPDYAPLRAELERILEGRNQRMPRVVARLNELGIAITEEDVVAVSGDAMASGRPHIADALVRLGVVRDRDEAFSELLSTGGPAYIPRYSTPLDQAIALVAAAGGVSVIAHPWGRYGATSLDSETLAALTRLGLTGIEVDHQDHSPQARAELRELARSLDLVVTGSSDYHGTGKKGHDLGCNTTAPAEFDRLLAAAEDAAEAVGRTVPEFGQNKER